MPVWLEISEHARLRLAQRNLSLGDLLFVLEHGRCMRSGHAWHVVLRGRDVPNDPWSARQFGHLEGATLVLIDENWRLVLLTAYRNRRALRQIRRRSA